MLNESKTALFLAFVTSSMCSLIYGGVLIASDDPVVDFIADTNHLAIMYGYIPSNMTAKRLDVYNTSTNITTTIENNVSIVYPSYISAQSSDKDIKLQCNKSSNKQWKK